MYMTPASVNSAIEIVTIWGTESIAKQAGYAAGIKATNRLEQLWYSGNQIYRVDKDQNKIIHIECNLFPQYLWHIHTEMYNSWFSIYWEKNTI